MIHNDGLGDYSISMLINNREEIRDRLKRQLLTGRKDVSASDNPDLYHRVNDIESKIGENKFTYFFDTVLSLTTATLLPAIIGSKYGFEF